MRPSEPPPGEPAGSAPALARTYRYDVGALGPSFARPIAVETPVEFRFGGVPFAVMMATPADLEDFALGTTGVIDEVDQYVGVPTDFAADTYALFNGPQTKASAVAAEQGGLIDAAAGATLTQIKTAFTSNTTAIVIGLLLFGGAIATGYYYGSK